MEAVAAVIFSITLLFWVTDDDASATVKTKDGTELECRID